VQGAKTRQFDDYRVWNKRSIIFVSHHQKSQRLLLPRSSRYGVGPLVGSTGSRSGSKCGSVR
jgi:hypothetical protein